MLDADRPGIKERNILGQNSAFVVLIGRLLPAALYLFLHAAIDDFPISAMPDGESQGRH
jgi:hypothetical protein